MKRESQWTALFLCVGVAMLTFLVSVSSAAAQGNGDSNGQNNNGSGDHDEAFAVRQGPGTNTGNCHFLQQQTGSSYLRSIVRIRPALSRATSQPSPRGFGERFGGSSRKLWRRQPRWGRSCPPAQARRSLAMVCAQCRSSGNS
jgi:hypothetical protein